MDEIPEIYAACIVQYARREANDVLVGPFYVIGKDARDAFSLPYSENSFIRAIEILENVGALTRYSRKGMQTFFRIEAGRFDSAMSKAAGGVRYYKMNRGFGAEPIEYSFLEAFHDIGEGYLIEALDSYKNQILDEADDFSDDAADDEAAKATLVDSTSWTGLPDDFSLSEERRSALVRELDRAESELANSGASQHEKAQARSLIVAARALLEAPDPQVDIAWELIGRANNLAGIASLFISIITLFLTAAH